MGMGLEMEKRMGLETEMGLEMEMGMVIEIEIWLEMEMGIRKIVREAWPQPHLTVEGPISPCA